MQHTKKNSAVIDKSNLSARWRKGPSAPAMWLVAHGKVQCGSNTLDYGCGRGTDADSFKWDRYDPEWFPNKIEKKYPCIVCIYVLNVITEEVANDVIKRVKGLLMPNGKAYFVVRRGVPIVGYGIQGHLQRMVMLDYPIVRKTYTYCIYELRKINGK